MSYQHKSLALGRWNQMPFMEQMANIGSEVERALNWRAKSNDTYCLQAAERALELMDLSLGATRNFPRLKELARVRESLVDYFFGTNEYSSTDVLLRNYFSSFTFSFRKHL